ncbi:MAG: sulfate transporter [Massilia sp.]|jgi:nucleotide-binding universal stress UspA family protein|nr:sulfate transporter [Massilia sp.]MDB5791115.1 sulfate transporter [Massilia sp.]
MFKQILLPTDGSELSTRAVLAGVSFAKEIGAQVVGMTALPDFHAFTANADMIESTEDEYLAASEARGNKQLAVVADAARSAGVHCTTVLARSDQPYEAILRAGRERGCDLIIMASHGRRGISGMLLGSETQKVLVHSAVPVMVYR